MKYTLNNEKMFADVSDGIAIIINSETGIYYGMNNLATIVYENLENGVNSDEILKALKSIEGAPKELDENFKLFIDTIIEKELMMEGSLKEGTISIDTDIAKEDNFILSIKEYSDAQELLLADPIHEVKEDTGWTPEKSSLNTDEEDVKKREAKLEK